MKLMVKKFRSPVCIFTNRTSAYRVRTGLSLHRRFKTCNIHREMDYPVYIMEFTAENRIQNNFLQKIPFWPAKAIS
jgi:hypothetical protein